MMDIIDTHRLVVVEPSNREVLLKASTYTLDIWADREGVNVVYFDKSSKPLLGYNLILFLLQNRRNLLTFDSVGGESHDYESFITANVSAIARHLRAAGGDILSGSKEWIASYSWPKVKPPAEIAQLL